MMHWIRSVNTVSFWKWSIWNQRQYQVQVRVRLFEHRPLGLTLDFFIFIWTITIFGFLGLEFLGQHNNHLSIVNISNCNINDSALTCLVKASAATLEELYCTSCYKITDRGILELCVCVLSSSFQSITYWLIYPNLLSLVLRCLNYFCLQWIDTSKFG